MVPDDFQGVLPLADVRVMVRKWAVDCGRRVSDRRVQRNMSCSELAAATDVTAATISRVEDGTLNARDHLKLVIAAALEVEVEALWPMPRRAEVLASTVSAA